MSAGAIQEILDADQRRCQALLENDLHALESLLHDELSYTHSSAVTDGKPAFLGNLRSGKVKYHALVRDRVRVRVFGAAATMNGRVTLEATRDGVRRKHDNLFLSVWVKTRGSWQMAAWASTAIPPG